MPSVILAPAAQDDLDEILLYIAQESGSADIALRWLSNIEERFQVLAENPLIGAARPDIAPTLRHGVVGNYLILYRPAKSGIEVARVLHGARDVKRVMKDEI